MIKISVITCTYNASHTIERTLRSVGEQQYTEVEHIIIDGKSTDDTIRKAEQYKRQSDICDNGHTVIIISEPDKGLYDAMNKGLKIASGDYLVYLNAGDTFPETKTLRVVAESINEGELLPGVLYGNTDLVDDEENFIRHRRLTPPQKLNWRSFQDGMVVCHQAFYALTSIARSTPYNIYYRYSADVDWCIRIMKTSEKEGRELRKINRVVVNYLDEGMTTINRKASLKERFAVMQQHYGLVITVLKHLWFIIRAVIKR